MLGQILPISFTQNLFYIAKSLYPIDRPEQPIHTSTDGPLIVSILAYGVLLLLLRYYAGKPVPTSIIFGTRLLLLIPFLSTRLVAFEWCATWINAGTIHEAYWISKYCLTLWGIYFWSTGSFSWEGTRANPAFRTLVDDMQLSIASAFIHEGAHIWSSWK